MGAIISVDPGRTGGVAWRVGEWRAVPMPVDDDGQVSFLALRELFTGIVVCSQTLNDSMPVAVVENLGMRPKQAGVINMVANWQKIFDALAASGIETVDVVQPKRWQKGRS